MLQAALGNREEEIRRELLQISSAEETRLYVEEIGKDDPVLRDRLLAWLNDKDRDSKRSLESTSPRSSPGDRPLIGERYRLLQEIGEGGFSTVYLAEQTAPVRRRVALKILKPGMDSRQIVARFELERQTLAMMDHPHIAKVHDAGVTELGRPYFVMELVRGVPITEFCEQAHLPLRQRLALFDQVCQAVQHAHQKGVIHRDLKPSNILVAAQEGAPEPKVIDFGIAKAMQSGFAERTVFTEEHHLLGTPAYISPEQAALSRSDIDTRSDIYSLGVLLYELLTGSTPFDTQELTKAGFDGMRRIILEREPLAPSSRSKQPAFKIDRDLDWIVLKALQKDRALRYPTANGLAMDVQRYLAHEPIVARPPSSLYRVSKFIRRNRVAVTLGGSLLLVLVAAVVVSAILSVSLANAKRESDRANQRLSDSVRYFESGEMEALAAEGYRTQPLAWLARQMRRNPMDPVPASRILSMLSLHNLALPAMPPLAHNAPVSSASYSPDGKQILTGSYDGTVRLWEAATGRPLGVITNPVEVSEAHYAAKGTRLLVVGIDHIARVYDAQSRALLCAAPLYESRYVTVDTPRGSWLYAAHTNRTVSRWDLQTGQRHDPTLTLASLCRSFDASGAADRVAVACLNKTVQLLRASTGQPLGPPRALEGTSGQVRFAPGGQRLFIPLDGVRLAIWDLTSSNAMTIFVPRAPMRTENLDFTPNGRVLLTHSWASRVQAWSLDPIAPLKALTGSEGQGGAVYDISQDGTLVAGGTQNGTVGVWDLQSGEMVLAPFTHSGKIREVRFNADHSRLVTAAQDGYARVWDIRMRRAPPVTFPLSRDGGQVYFNHAGTRVLVSVHPRAVQVCDARTGKPNGPLIQQPDTRSKAHICAFSFSRDDRFILTAVAEGVVQLWDAESFQLKRELSITRPIVSARLSPDTKYVVACDKGGLATMWSRESGQILGTAKFADEAISLDFNPQSSAFVVSSVDGTARAWRLPSGEPAGPPLRHAGIVWSARYSPDGRRIVTASGDHTAQIWDAATGQRLGKPMQHEKDVFSAQFSPDGQWVLTTSEDGTARVWNGLNGKPVSRLLRHTSLIWMGAFSSDSRWVATGSDDRTARLWDPRSGLPLSEPLLHSGPLVQLSFSPDDRRLLTFGGQAALWDVLIAPTPVPTWFGDLAEAVAGARLTEDSQLQIISQGAIGALRQRLAAGQETGFYARWAKWFLIDRMQDTAPPCPMP